MSWPAVASILDGLNLLFVLLPAWLALLMGEQRPAHMPPGATWETWRLR